MNSQCLAFFAAITLVGGFSGSVHAQAFGINKGAELSSYSPYVALPSEGPWAFSVTPPTPNGLFGRYTAYALPNAGICAVWGDAVVERDVIFNVADQLRTALIERYGTPSAGGAIAAVWGMEKEFPDDLGFIQLLETSVGLRLTYHFDNYRECTTEASTAPPISNEGL